MDGVGEGAAAGRGYWVAARKGRCGPDQLPGAWYWNCEACNYTLQAQPQGSEYRTRKTRGDRG